jgi:hypothetical protein
VWRILAIDLLLNAVYSPYFVILIRPLLMANLFQQMVAVFLTIKEEENKT